MTSPIDLPRSAAPAAPGRSCPLHYRYRPEALAVAAPAQLQALDVLYVVGGLYGNEPALHRVLELFEAEPGEKRLVFNGDFHWFDADPAVFARIQQAVMSHAATRGNVETELADDSASADAGCGCAYPEWVGDGVVERSNRILTRLRGAVTAAQRAELAALPMTLRADVAGVRIGIVHGDAESLAGWGFAQEHLQEPAQRQQAEGWLVRAQVHAFACSHTCLPVFQRLGVGVQAGWVLNNGAAGMPNFSGETAGLLTRIAREPFAGPQRRYGVVLAGGEGAVVHAEAIGLDIDTPRWHAQFIAQWPAGSDAHASYFERLIAGPAYTVALAVRA
jgi:hypothetical protein